VPYGRTTTYGDLARELGITISGSLVTGRSVVSGAQKVAWAIATCAAMSASWTLTGPDGAPYQSDRPGTLGGHRRSKLYGRLDCRSALQALARGGYALDRVFFLDEHAAQAADYRPCAVCLPDQYAAWKTGAPIAGLDRRSVRTS
jgi:hypothetical protein